jgi:23S rRNA (uracil1939-C5)-methyltransferase
MAELIKNLEITTLVHGGRGLGRHNNKAIFVPMTAPGDFVTCRITRSKKSFAEADLVEVTKPATVRRCPPCPYYGQCGGCQWQHLPYAKQLYWKEKSFADQLIRNGLARQGSIQPIMPSDEEWHYRNRVQFKCRMARQGLTMGFFRHGSHDVVDIDHCMLLTPRIQAVYDLLRTELPDSAHPESVSGADVAAGDDGKVRIVLHVSADARDDMKTWLYGFARRHQVCACLQSGHINTLEAVYGETSLTVSVDHPEMTLAYGPGGFAQVNSGLNRTMVNAAIAAFALQGTERVLDLFCGMGNFSLPVARRAKQVYGVEDYAPSIEYARRNALANQLANVTFQVGDAAACAARLQPGDIDLVILDPPRSGSSAAIKEIVRLRPEQILYISCDPATLARDLKPLLQDGYLVVSARTYDLFPQSWHIESMTLLRKTGPMGRAS